MPFGRWRNFSECKQDVERREGYSDEQSDKVCGKLKSELEKSEPAVNEWTFDPSSILMSPRKVRGKFHTPQVDRDNEYIDKSAIQNAVPDFMHLPILHDFHKERTVGIVTRVVELSDGSFDFEGLIKATDDCNDIWELIKAGRYDQVSIYGKRLAGTSSCSLRPEQRMEPCTTTGVRLDSISVCDSNARNDGTSLMVAKGAKVVFEATEEIIKAETTGSNLMHTVTDYPKRKFGSDGLPRTKKKCTATCPQYERPDVEKGDDMDVTEEEKGEQRIPLKPKPKPKPGIREAGEGDKKSSMMKGDSVAAIINSIADDLESLVMADQKELDTPHATDQVEPSGEEEWEDQPPTESDREYGTPEDATYDEEKARGQPKFKQSLGDAGAIADRQAEEVRGKTQIPEHAKHLAARYLMEKHYEDEDAKKKQSEEHAAMVQRKKENYINPPSREPLRADSAVSDEPVFRNQFPEPPSEEEKAEPEEEFSPEEERAPAEARPKVRPPWMRGDVGYAAHQDAQPELPDVEASRRAKREQREKEKAREKATEPRPYGTPPRESETITREKHTGDPFYGRKEGKFSSDRYGDTVPYKEKVKRTDLDEPFWKKPEGAKQPPWTKQKHSSEGEAGFRRRTGETEESYLPHAKEAAEAAKRPEPVRPTTLTSDEPPRNQRIKLVDPGQRLPTKVMPTHKLEIPHEELKVPPREYKTPEYHTEYKEFHPQTEEGKKFKREVEANQFSPKRGKPTAEGTYTEQFKDFYQGEQGEEKAEVDGGGDLQASVERLAKLVSMLVESDRRVHAEIGGSAPEPNEEEKCGSISKGTETMEDKEVDLLVKAKVDAKIEEITKAYQVSLDELKKANAELATRIEKMEKETITKSGVVAILRDGDEDVGTVFKSNAEAISAITKSKAKV